MNDRLPNHSQMIELLYQMTKWRMSTDESLTDLEKEIAADYASRKDGKVFATDFYKYSVNSTSSGERVLGSVGMNCVPSTDTVAGNDDFLNHLIFQWTRCNYTRDEDETARVHALFGHPGYKENGAVDVGTLSATFYWKYENRGSKIRVYMSDSPHPELSLVPWINAVKADGTVLPYYIVSSFPSTNVDGLNRSQHGIPVYNQSYSGCITAYAKKGTGYQGAGASRNLHGMLFLMIKYATKNVQKIFAGCSNFNAQPKCAIAESNVKRVLVSVNSFQKGDCVSVGDGSNTDRNNAAVHNIVNRAIVDSVTTVAVNGTNYYALNLDVSSAFTTTTNSIVSSMPCPSGQTDAVIGNFDGSFISNTDAKHSFRIHGVEYMNGQWMVDCDTVMERQDNDWIMYVAPKGVKHNNERTNYLIAGKLPANGGADYWGGDIEVDYRTGSFNVVSIGGGDSIGVGDRIYTGGSPGNGTRREKLTLGGLRDGSYVGFARVSCRDALSSVGWPFGSCD